MASMSAPATLAARSAMGIDRSPCSAASSRRTMDRSVIPSSRILRSSSKEPCLASSATASAREPAPPLCVSVPSMSKSRARFIRALLTRRGPQRKRYARRMTNFVIRAAAAFALASMPAFAGDPPKPPAEKLEFEQFTLVLLMRPQNAPKLEEKRLDELQKQHLGHLGRMVESGKMVVAGPFGDQKDPAFRGGGIYLAPPG